jgi:NitT/TauT family transport system substrate-binding protein
MQYTLSALKDGGFITGPDASGSQIGRMSADRWRTTNDQLTQLGVIRHPIDPTRAFTINFLPQ